MLLIVENILRNEAALGTGTDFQFFLSEMAQGHIYYDPGIKMEMGNASSKPEIKRRSQFRIKSLHLPNLYRNNLIVDTCDDLNHLTVNTQQHP
jgi:MvaI/BcnI restriction endonuclease family